MSQGEDEISLFYKEICLSVGKEIGGNDKGEEEIIL